VLVRDAAAMRDTFSLVPPYLRTEGTTDGVSAGPWLSEYGFQQTRGFRALKVWMALRYHGLSGYRSSIERDIRLAAQLASLLRSREDIESLEPQSLSIVCFRYAPPELRRDEKAIDSLNKTILVKLQLGGKAFLSSTVLDGRFWLRACIINPRSGRPVLPAAGGEPNGTLQSRLLSLTEGRTELLNWACPAPQGLIPAGLIRNRDARRDSGEHRR
jgi:aromatic-L-amino-acid/L-tryptophan decarboxylase